jgi:hypothetical protein
MSKGFFDGIDAFGRAPCPGCGTLVTLVTHIDKPGSPDGQTVIDIDFMPMAEHMVDCGDQTKGNPRG